MTTDELREIPREVVEALRLKYIPSTDRRTTPVWCATTTDSLSSVGHYALHRNGRLENGCRCGEWTWDNPYIAVAAFEKFLADWNAANPDRATANLEQAAREVEQADAPPACCQHCGTRLDLPKLPDGWKVNEGRFSFAGGIMPRDAINSVLANADTLMAWLEAK